MIRRQPRSTRTDPLFPYTTLFRSYEFSCFAPVGIGDRDDLKHPGMHVVEKVAVKSPVARFVRRQVELRAATRLQDDRVLERLPIGRRAIAHRTAESRVGKECVGTCSSRGSARPSKQKIKKTE